MLRHGSCLGFQPEHGTPTKALPGSAKKIVILSKRVTNGEELFHEQDADFFNLSDEILVKRRPIHLTLDKRIKLTTRETRRNTAERKNNRRTHLLRKQKRKPCLNS